MIVLNSSWKYQYRTIMEQSVQKRTNESIHRFLEVQVAYLMRYLAVITLTIHGRLENFQKRSKRIMNKATMEHAYDGLLWTLWSLQGLSSVLLRPFDGVECSSKVEFTNNQLYRGLHTIWNTLLRGLPMFNNVTSVADAALILLGNINLSDPVNNFIIGPDVWDLRLFKSSPSLSLLRFISGYFSKKGSHGDLQDVLHLRKDLLRTVMGLLNWKVCLAILTFCMLPKLILESIIIST